MKQRAIQQNAIGSSCEELQSSISVSVMVTDRRETMVCPKPRRLGLLNASFNDQPVRSLRWQLSHQTELCDSKAGSDILDMILTKLWSNGGVSMPEMSFAKGRGGQFKILTVSLVSQLKSF
ncbi:hypothetical protein GOBAR_AA35598 [Gossypium barbadense]|uniref:Uncharacterized protein n=1 Tax=Gossypium barbadense TaxID=3634 RepID=A0A2P5W1Y5_GOSBA|nr:hypothetical protein GOBAR_AA35598 [Gossypium barbadense]